MISVVDYGMGNLRSVEKSLERIGAKVEVISKPAEVLHARLLLLPGVGHFKRGVQNLKDRNLWEALNEAVMIKKTPVLGICLGMQLMTEHSEEGDVDGFGWISAETKRFPHGVMNFKVPHMGWNQSEPIKSDVLFRGITDSPFYYFVHSYFVSCSDVLTAEARTKYITDFTSSFEKENIFGCQFHPEKSHDSGLAILKNFSVL